MLDTGTTIWHAYLYWALFSFVCALIAGVLTVYVGPGAMGSGVPEVMGMLNGVNFPGALGIATLIVKIVAVEFAVISNLCVGKEGPLLHIGAIVGVMMPYLPIKAFECFRNDSDKRTFMAAGSSAGVSAAFASPIGGALFTYEISKPNTFWTFSMLWRVFFSCAISTITLGLLSEMYEGTIFSLNSTAILKFGNLSYIESPLSDVVVAIVLGIVCGLLGALFIHIYSYMHIFRKKFINTGPKKVFEVVLFSFVTCSVFFWFSDLLNVKCETDDNITFDEEFQF